MCYAIQRLLSVIRYVLCNSTRAKCNTLFALQFSCCGVYGDINSTTSWAFYRNTVWYLNQTGERWR